MAVSYAQILADVQARMAGRANAFTPSQYQSAINEGLAELWKALVATTDDFFLQFTTTTAGQTNTFAALSTTVREYTLPGDCLRPRFIEVLAPAGYERVQFLYRKIHHPEFITQRNNSTAVGPSSSTAAIDEFTSVYYYTIAGKNTLVLARYPEQPFTLKVWYVRALPILVSGGTLDETVAPFANEITTFATKRLQSIGGDPGAFAVWSEAWRGGIVGTVQAAGPRSETNAQYAAESEY